MKKNVGGIDKIIRYILGIIILILGLIFHTWWGLIGLIPIFTAVIGWCPFYVPLKISTTKEEKKE